MNFLFPGIINDSLLKEIFCDLFFDRKKLINTSEYNYKPLKSVSE